MKVSLLTFLSTTFFHSQSHQQCIYLPEKKDKISLKAASEKKQFPQYSLHKTSKFHLISCCLNLWKHRLSAEYWVNHSKICGNCAFPQNFHISRNWVKLRYFVQWLWCHTTSLAVHFKQVSNMRCFAWFGTIYTN